MSIPVPEMSAPRASVPATRPPSPAPTATPPPVTPESAAARYFKGDTADAIRTYERVIAQNPKIGAQAYQELGWLYYQSGRRADAANAYRQSLERYRQQLAAGQDVQAAQRGIRTAQAALRVLETE